MKKVFSVIAGLSSLLSPAVADEAGMKRVLAEWNTNYSDWMAAYKVATTEERRAELLKSMPEGVSVARELWREVAKDLKKPYALPAVAWLLNHSDDLAEAFPKKDQARKIMIACLEAMESDLALYKGAGEAAYALSMSKDLRCRAILENMKNYNQNTQDQGLAALGLAIAMKEHSGMKQDNPRLIAARSKLLKDAIVKIRDLKGLFGPMIIEDLIKAEIYEMNNLTIGVKGPGVNLKSSSGLQMNVPSGKSPVLLVFWDPRDDRSVRFLEKAASLRERFPELTVLPVAPANEEVIGNALLNLNLNMPSLVDEHSVAFKDFRVDSVPYVYMLAPKGKVLLRGVPDMLFDVKLDAEMKKLATVKNTPAAEQAPPAPEQRPSPTPEKRPSPSSAPIVEPSDLSAPPLRDLPE